jgi:MOSC domain-containing protein YiiM
MVTEVINIFISQDKGKPMQSLDYVEALTGLGLAGDRYALRNGTWAKNPQKRQVSFIAIEAIEEANKQLDVPFLPEETRRNIVLKGVDVNSLVGKIFKFGSVVFKGTELCDPCDHPSRLIGKKNFKETFDNRGGLRAEVLFGGMITIGEMTLQIIENTNIDQMDFPDWRGKTKFHDKIGNDITENILSYKEGEEIIDNALNEPLP